MTTQATTTMQIIAALDLAGVNDGDRVRFDVTSKRTGETVSVVLRRETFMRFGSTGATGYWVDVYDADRDAFVYVTTLTTAEPLRSWGVGSGKTSKASKALTAHVRWICDHLCRYHDAEELLRVANVTISHRFASEQNRKRYARHLECYSLPAGVAG